MVRRIVRVNGGWEDGRGTGPCDVYITGRIQSDRIAIVIIGATEIGRVADGRCRIIQDCQENIIAAVGAGVVATDYRQVS